MRRGELSSLTGIRFYAALLVYLYHVVLTVPGVKRVERRQSVFQCGRRRRIVLLCPQRIHPDVQLRGRVPGRHLRRQLHALCLGSADENLSCSLVDAAAGAAHRDLQSAPPPRLARCAPPSVSPAMLLAVLDAGVFRLLERPVMEHQLRVVLLSPCPGGHVLRVGEPPSLGASGCGHGLCVRPRIAPLARSIRRGSALFRFPVRSLEVCGFSGGRPLGPRLSDVGAKTRGSFRPGAGDGYRDRKSTRLNSSHGYISYAVFCLKKKKIKRTSGLEI